MNSMLGEMAGLCTYSLGLAKCCDAMNATLQLISLAGFVDTTHSFLNDLTLFCTRQLHSPNLYPSPSSLPPPHVTDIPPPPFAQVLLWVY